MGTFEDLTGKKIGFLTIMYRAEDWVQPSGQHKRMWHCLCDCGKECDVRASDIKSGNTTSCGCQSSKVKSVGLEDLTGKIFGDFEVVKRSPNKITPSGQQTRVWHCRCTKCGIERDIQASQIKKWSGECECTKLVHKQETEQKKLAEKIAKEKKQEEIRKAKELEKSKKAELKYVSQMIKKQTLDELRETKSEVHKKIHPVKKINYRVLNEELVNNWKVSYPELFREWDTLKNESIMDTKISATTKVWWICSKGHSYDMRVSSRITQNCGCPYCSVPAKRVLPGFNDLATKYPICVSEWDYEKNDILPTEVLPGSGRKVWWKCKRGHSFEQSICYKTGNSNLISTCPYCSNQKLLSGFNDLATTHPDILNEWDYEKNKVLPSEIGVGTHKKIWWKCPFGHSYQAYPSNRCGKQHTGCPICDKENHTSFPEQAIYYYVKQYFPDTINSDRTRIGMELDIYIPSVDTAIEYDGHTWHNNNQYELKKNKQCIDEGVTLIRIREEGLPLYNDCKCFIRYNLRSNESLSNTIKDLLRFLLHRNIDVDVEQESSQIYSFYVITRKSKSLASTYPEIAAEWHPSKNGNLTPEMVAPLTGKKVWWLGPCGHEYQMDVSDRTYQNCGCPYCSGKRILVGFNDFETWCIKNDREDLLEEWDYQNNPCKPSEISPHSDKKIIWICNKCHFIWKTKVDSRTRMNSGCPECGKVIIAAKKFKRVYNIDTGIEYESLKDAEEKTGLNRTCISNVCKGKQKTAGGYHWKFIDN